MDSKELKKIKTKENKKLRDVLYYQNHKDEMIIKTKIKYYMNLIGLENNIIKDMIKSHGTDKTLLLLKKEYLKQKLELIE